MCIRDSTDTTAPTATASVASTTYTRAITATMGTTGTFTVGAVAGGVAEGIIGNLWTFEAIEGTAGAVPAISVYDTVTRKIGLAADFTPPTTASTPTADNICSTINGHAAISGNFKCLVVAGGTSAAVVASTSLSGGAATHLVDVTFSETMAAAFSTASYYQVDSDADLDYEGTDRTVDNFIRSLRVKLEDDPTDPRHIRPGLDALKGLARRRLGVQE